MKAKWSMMMLGIFAAACLSGCESGNSSHTNDNPLMSKNVVNYLKKQMDTKSPEKNPVTQCGSYYAGYVGTEEHKNYCDEWSVKEFKVLHQNLQITTKATIEDLRDPALWKMVIPKEKPALS